MIKQLFQKLIGQKKLMYFIGMTVIVLLAVAVIAGLLNGLIADGTWSFGWSSYRYDESGYEIGSGTIRENSITGLELDWLDGEVHIVLCDDAFISLTETYQGEVADTALLRYRVSEDGTTLSIKYRASAAFLGCGGTEIGKNLTVRIPKAMASMKAVAVKGESARILIDGISADSMSVTSKTGDVILSNGETNTLAVETVSGNVDCTLSVCSNATMVTKRGNLKLESAKAAESLDLKTQKGNIILAIPEECGFRLSLDADKSRFACDRSLTGTDEGYSYGNATTEIKLSAPKGSVTINTFKKI